MEVEQVTPFTYCHRHVVFKTGYKCMGPSWSNELEKGEFATLTSERSRLAVSLRQRRIQDADVPTRAPRSRSSPDRRTDNSSPRRNSSPSTTALRNAPLPAAPATLSPLLYNYCNNPYGVVAFYSPRPPTTPLFLVHLPPNPAQSSGQDKSARPAELPTKVKNPDKKEKKCKKFKNKESKKVVRYVMQSVLHGVYAGLTSRAHAQEALDGSRGNVEPVKDASASPLFHSVASQTTPKTSFIRSTADAGMDDVSISSEERCTELDESCAWVSNVRALRDSHVRLVLRQLQQLRDIERLDRTLQRAHAPPRSPARTPPAASAPHSAC